MQRMLTIFGTIRTTMEQSNGNADAITVAKSRKLFSNRHGFQRDATLVSYCPKKTEVITLLNIMSNNKGIGSSSENKPETSKYYNSTKGGIDTMD